MSTLSIRTSLENIRTQEENRVPDVTYRPVSDIAVLEIDHPPVNALSIQVREGLVAGLRRAASEPLVKAIVIAGARGAFPAGADINEIISGLSHKSPIIREVQAMMEASDKPIVAAIEGTALGGGFELALACHWRVCARSAKVGLPEVKLGLIPGAGGTQRFTRLAGPEAALEAITSGAHLPSARALEIGVVDELADEAVAAAIELARRVVRENRELRLASAVADRITNIDASVFTTFRARIAAKARGQLAPWKAIDAIEACCTRPKEEAFRLEREWFNECRDSPQRAALMHVFFAEREARRIADMPPDVRALPIRTVGIVGAGTMGGGIAMSFAAAGIPVTLVDVSQEAVERGLGTIRRNYSGSVSRGNLARERMEELLGSIHIATDFAALAHADLVIEAAFEDLEVKRGIFRKLDQVAAPEAILATNTSTLDIDAIAAATARPQNVIGTHFFSPANVMKLLENVRGRRSSPQTIATVMELGRRLGKVAVLAGNSAGFIGNRMLQFYSYEAEFLLEEGATPEQVDRVMEDFGFAMGPLAVRDLAGNDVGLLIRKGRRLAADERRSPILERLVAAGRLGQKSGKGFYLYDGRARSADPRVLELIEAVAAEQGIARRPLADAEILDRLLHPLVNEGARVLEEGIAMRAGDIDVVFVNGYGFPAYRGGPMYWAEQVGLDRIIATMRRLAPTHGSRWQPAPLLLRLAESGRGWKSVANAEHPGASHDRQGR
jgi:3-hydroxyacyl-CoA dehydrogenase